MANFGSIHFFNLIICCLFLSTTTATGAELVDEVCKNTTNFNFCHNIIYSYPSTWYADKADLAYIVFQETHYNATDTSKYIASLLKSTDRKSKPLYDGLKKCQEYYDAAVRALSEVLTNLDSDTYIEFDKQSIDVSSFPGQSPISKRNEDLIQLSNVCLAVANLFHYN